MSECIRWKSVIPKFQEGDIIIPFEGAFQKQRKTDVILDGGINHRDILEECASVRRKKSQKEGVYYKDGRQILPEKFDECKPVIYNSGDFYVTAIKVKEEGLYGMYRDDGKMIVPAQFVDVYVVDYLVVVRDKKRLYGAYSLSGEKVIDCEYDAIQVCSSLDEGYGGVIVSKNGLLGAMSENGTEIIPIKFNWIDRKVEGYIVYTYGTDGALLKGWYSQDGKKNIPCVFASLKFDYKKIKVKTQNGLKGIYSYDGREILPPKFESISYIGNYIVGMIGDDKLSIYNLSGSCLYCTE